MSVSPAMAPANLIGRYEGHEPDAPALLIGSHSTASRDAGRYDGPLGIMLGVEAVAALHDAGRRLPFAIEVIAFGDEEGSRFPAAMLTSRAVAGTLERCDALEIADAAGVESGRRAGARRIRSAALSDWPHARRVRVLRLSRSAYRTGPGARSRRPGRRRRSPALPRSSAIMVAADRHGGPRRYLRHARCAATRWPGAAEMVLAVETTRARRRLRSGRHGRADRRACPARPM